MKKDNPLLQIGFFRLARNTSKFSNFKIRMGAVVSKHGKPISSACNKKKTHPEYSNPEKMISGCIHAEIRAILNSDCNLTGASIYVYREYKNGNPALSKPCGRCMNKIKEVGIKRVYYTTTEEPYYRMEIVV